MLLHELQNLLGEIYGIDVPGNIYDFLVTDLAFAKHLMGNDSNHDPEEQLLVVQSDECIDIALYLDEAILERLITSDPCAQLHQNNLGDFWTVIEGISHFNYLAWNASFDKAVTLMELELQAEVDKYVSTRMLLQDQPGGELGGWIMTQLFEKTSFSEHLSAEQLERYRSASAFASRYCYSLENRFTRDRVDNEMMTELRAFYRLPQPDKVSHIQSAQLT
jgi:hypothetical protein